MKKLIAVALYLGTFFVSAQFEIRKEHEVHELKVSKKENGKYVDVIVVNYRGSGISWRDLKKKIIKTQSHYRSAGVQLNVVRSVTLKTPNKHKGFLANGLNGVDPERGTAPYEASVLRGNYLHPRAKNAFNNISYLANDPENTIFIVIARSIGYKGWYTRNDERVILNKGIQGFSFPPYSFLENIPRELRGFTAVLQDVSAKTISHELGHKLINVSHEGLGSCPRFEGGGVPGLMGYGRSAEIYSGKEGRYHRERLHLSPFVYTIKDQKRVQNPDYLEGGHYRDPIYGDKFLTPACP